MRERILEFGQGVRSPSANLIFKAPTPAPQVFGRVMLPDRAGRMHLASYGWDADGNWTGFVEEEEADVGGYFYLYVGGGEFEVQNAGEMREVILGMEDSKRERRAEREARWSEGLLERVRRHEEQIAEAVLHPGRKRFFMGGN